MSYLSFSSKIDINESVIYNLKNLLVSQGWVIKSSSDGITYNSSGDQITSDVSLTTTRAWFRIQCPSMGGITREMTFQRNDTNNWRIKYQYTGGFIGGTITQTPSGVGEKIILGAGTDASPSFALLFSGQPPKYCAMSAGNSVEGFSFFSSCETSVLSTCHFFMMDRISLDSVSVGDVDGYTFFFSPGAITNANVITNSFSYYLKGLAGEGFVLTPIFNWSVNTFSNTSIQLGPNLNNSYCNLLPPLYARETSLAAPNGYKGFSHMVKLSTCSIANFQLINSSSQKDKIICDIFALPWDGSNVNFP